MLALRIVTNLIAAASFWAPTSAAPITSHPQSHPHGVQESERTRLCNAMRLLQGGDSPARVLMLLGQPDDIRAADDPDLRGGWEEAWCYGTSGHLSFPTLGEVVFSGGRLDYVVGDRGYDPPAESQISEIELRAALRFMDDQRALSEVLADAPGSSISSLSIIRVVNYLRALGPAKLSLVLKEYARLNLANEPFLEAILLCMTEVPTALRYIDVSLSQMYFTAVARPTFPRFPIMIFDGIPLFIPDSLGGSANESRMGPHFSPLLDAPLTAQRPFVPPNDPFKALDNLSKSERSFFEYGQEPGRSASNVIHTEIQNLVINAVGPQWMTSRLSSFGHPSFDEAHRHFLEVGGHWDPRLQMYVQRDGSYWICDPHPAPAFSWSPPEPQPVEFTAIGFLRGFGYLDVRYQLHMFGSLSDGIAIEEISQSPSHRVLGRFQLFPGYARSIKEEELRNLPKDNSTIGFGDAGLFEGSFTLEDPGGEPFELVLHVGEKTFASPVFHVPLGSFGEWHHRPPARH